MPPMLKKCTAFCCLFIGLFCSGFAQKVNENNFNPPPDSLFNEIRYQSDGDAPFIYTLKELDITFEESGGSIIAVMDYHVRMKVLDASNPQVAVVGIPYYRQDEIEQVTSIQAVTWNSPTQSSVLDEDAVRTIDLNTRYTVKEFTMPEVQEGSVLEYSYQIRRRYIEELPAFYFANQVPTVLAKVTITYPQYLRYKAVVQDSDFGVKHKEMRTPVYQEPQIFTNPQPDPILKEVWTARDIPAVQKEKYISALSDYRGKIKFQLSEFGIPRQPLENSWKYVVEEIRQKQSPFKAIKNNKKAFRAGANIRKAVSSKEAAQDSIFKYLLKKVKYNGENTPFSSTLDRAVLSGHEADQAAINQTLIAMLRGAGITAYPVLISTRKSGKINKGYPSFFQFNGQLVHSQIGEKTYLMDASFSYSQPGLIPVQAYNQTGLLLKDSGFHWININPPNSVFAIQVDLNAELQPNGTLKGHIAADFRGYSGRQIRLSRSKDESLANIAKELLFKNYLDIQLSNISLQTENDFDQPTKLTADFVVPDYATVFSRGIRFRPMVVGYLSDNPFDKKQRELPVTLDAPEKLKLNYSITLPEGFSLPSFPDNQTFKLPGAAFTEKYDMNGQAFHYQFKINIDQKQFSKKLYPRLLNLYQRWVELSKMRLFAQ